MNKTWRKVAVFSATTLLVVMTNGAVFAADRVSLTDIEGRLANIESALYVPFKVQIAGGICDTGGAGTSNPLITIDSNAPSGVFLVTGVLVRTNDIPSTGFVALSLNRITIDGIAYDTRTANLTDNVGGTGVQESFDIMGTPVQVTANLNDHTPGGNVPHQIAADAAGNNDIPYELFCRTDDLDLTILNIMVTGWKRPSETVAVTYTPGD